MINLLIYNYPPTISLPLHSHLFLSLPLSIRYHSSLFFSLLFIVHKISQILSLNLLF